MPSFALIHWSYVAIALAAAAILIAIPFLSLAFRSARALAYTRTDDFPLSSANMWTEPHHAPDGGSLQLMRLKDDQFVLVSVGVSTVKVFVTPDRSDITRYRELQEFPLHSAFERISQSSQQRRAEDLLFLERVRHAIGWPQSASDLASSLQSIDSSLLLHGRKTPNQSLQPTADRPENLHMMSATLKFAAKLGAVSGGRAYSR